MTHILIDAEYTYTCAMRNGMVPNYKAIIDLFRKRHTSAIIYTYFVGDKKQKKGISDFLTKIGVDYIVVMDVEHVWKTQIVGSQMAIDAVSFILGEKDLDNYVFLSGDDYLIPIVEWVSKYNMTPHVYYFPLIIADGLKNSKHCKLFKLTDGFFTFPKER